MWICTFEVCRQSGANRALNAGLVSQHGLSLSGEILIEALCEFECWEAKLRDERASESNANLAQNNFLWVKLFLWSFSWRFAVPVWCSGLVQVLQQGLGLLNSGPCSRLGISPNSIELGSFSAIFFNMDQDSRISVCWFYASACCFLLRLAWLSQPWKHIQSEAASDTVICMNSNAVHVLWEDRQSCRDVASPSSLGIWAVQTPAIPQYLPHSCWQWSSVCMRPVDEHSAVK